MSTWSEYRLEVFGEPYLGWHDGADFDEIFPLIVSEAGPADVLVARVRKHLGW